MEKKAGFIPEKLVMGVLWDESLGGGSLDVLEEELTARWGTADLVRGDFPFGYTDYYASEMGSDVVKRFYAFGTLRDPAELAEIKEETNGLEVKLAERFSRGGRRRINLDPGFLALSRFVLATTKEHAHRIPLARGIYGEVTLLFRRGAFQPLEWTYPDFQSGEYRRVLGDIRGIYKEQLREKGFLG